MAYVTQADILAVVPADMLTVAVDDRNMGADTDSVWDVIATAAARRIDSILGSRYSVPFADPAPPLVREAAVIFAAHMLYLRRQAGDRNPWIKEAEQIAERLQRVADGLADLDVADSDADPYAITEPSRTYNADGRLIL
jgi:phage gp36-like protein